MAAHTDVTMDHCIYWTTPNRANLMSTRFTVEKMDCHLEFHKGRKFDCDYRLYLFSERTPDKTFNLSVRLTIGTDVVSLSRTTYPLPKAQATSPVADSIIWKGHISELSKVVADFDEHDLHFKIVLQERTATDHKQRIADENNFLHQIYTERNLGTDSLSRDLEKLLDSEDSTADIVLSCGDREFNVHRCLLTSRSEVFASMLRSDMLEGKTGRVEIRDVETELFEQFVRYLYTGKLPKLTAEKAMLLYEIGDRYSVDALKTQCGISLKKNLTPTNACDVLLLADRHSDSDLKEGTVAYMLDQKIPLRDDVWLDFSTNHPGLAIVVSNRFCKLLASSK